MPPNSIMISPSKLDMSLAHLRQRPEASIKSMVSSLEKRGQLNPIIAAGDIKHMILIDGFKRHQAAQIIGIDKLFALILPLSGSQMKVHVYLLNRNESFSFVEECLLIHELVEKDGLSQKDVSIMLERHKSWVSRRLDIYRRLDSQIIEDIRVGLLPSGSGRTLARLPQCNQVDMGAAIQRDCLKVNEISQLIDLWCKADNPEAKRFVIESSKKALELSRNVPIEKNDPRVPSSAQGWFKAVCNLKVSATILKQRSMQGFGAMNSEGETILNQALGDAEKECREAISCAYNILQQGEKND